MKFKDLINLMSCKDGTELFEKIRDILSGFYIDVYDEDGDVKNIRDLCYEIAEHWNRE